MSTKKSGGSTKNGRDSQSQRLGLKVFGNQTVKQGGIIVRQRGVVFRAGNNVQRAKDDSLFSLKEGRVSFSSKKIRRFTGKLKKAVFINVE